MCDSSAKLLFMTGILLTACGAVSAGVIFETCDTIINPIIDSIVSTDLSTLLDQDPYTSTLGKFEFHLKQVLLWMEGKTSDFSVFSFLAIMAGTGKKLSKKVGDYAKIQVALEKLEALEQYIREKDEQIITTSSGQ